MAKGFDSAADRCNMNTMEATTTKKESQMLTTIIFSNTGKQHTNARCGSTRKNRVVNSPKLVTEVTDPCGRCSQAGPYMTATIDHVYDAWNQTVSQERRNPYATQESLQSFRQYATKQAAQDAQRMLASWEVK